MLISLDLPTWTRGDGSLRCTWPTCFARAGPHASGGGSGALAKHQPCRKPPLQPIRSHDRFSSKVLAAASKWYGLLLYVNTCSTFACFGSLIGPFFGSRAPPLSRRSSCGTPGYFRSAPLWEPIRASGAGRMLCRNHASRAERRLTCCLSPTGLPSPIPPNP